METVFQRPRLVKRLAEHPDRTILICAPCGYGKSVLLEQWAAADPRSVVSLSLRRDHDDASLLAASVVEALSGGGPWPEAVAAGIAEGAADFHGEVLARFLTEVAAQRGPFVLALDDVSNLRGPESAQLLEALARTMPPGSQLALASRVDPPIRLARLRASRLLTEVRRSDLTMTKGECAQALAQMGVELSGRRLDTAVQQTEGWPAAIYLLGLTLRESTDRSRILARFSGANPLIADYLREELLLPLPEGLWEFLRRVSPLERFSASLCDAVFDRADSEPTIRRLAGTSILRGLDHRGEWFALHPLLRGLLQVELRGCEPDEERSVHARASAWWESEGFESLAMHHAAEAGDPSRAGRLFWALAPGHLVHGQADDVVRWLKRIGAPTVAGSAELSLTKSWCRLALGSAPEAQHWAAVARDALGSDTEPEWAPGISAVLALGDATLARRGIAGEIEALRWVEAHLPEGSPWRSAHCFLTGVAAHLQGDVDAARIALEEGAHRAAFDVPLFEALCRSQLALLELDRGDFERACAEAARARSRVGSGGLAAYPIAALVFSASACGLAAQGSLDRAAADLRVAESLLGQLDDYATWYEIEVRILVARTHVRLGHRREANEHLAAAAAQAKRVPDGPAIDRWIGEASDAIATLSSPAADLLTPAELRVLQLLPTHLSLPQIGGSLCVSPNTVKTHARSIYAKFGVSSRRAAVAKAERVGLLDSARPALALG